MRRTVAIAVALWAGLTAAAGAEDIRVGTGGVTGVYYPVGSGLCRMVNRTRGDHGLRCSVVATEGSVANARGLAEGELSLAIVQSDVQAMAVSGAGVFRGAGVPQLRALFSLHPEPVHLMVRGDARIAGPGDLAGKRVSLAREGSGSRVIAEVLLAAAGLSADDLAVAAELLPSEQAKALCADTLDATVWTAGVPNGATADATEACDVRIVPLDGPSTAGLLAGSFHYGAATIPGGLYRGNPDDIATWGPRATLVTTDALSEAAGYALVRAVFEAFETFRAVHPALADLDPEAMATTALIAPIHPGAERYFRERGWR
ncbi:TAXI family TRAP transporter solute-binding subunit [Rhodobacteraceae bacterium CCMM004]|nr:TAXI family TRAP transporter solute-binding subunit [Rhodobacteraceae bacterium CCMM004]